MPSLLSGRFHVFLHGGRTRKLLSIEIGRWCQTRGINYTTPEEVISVVRQWLVKNGCYEVTPDAPLCTPVDGCEEVGGGRVDVERKEST